MRRSKPMMGVVQKIFYFHVPCAFMLFLSAFVCAGGSVAYLFKGSEAGDRVAAAAGEIAVLFGACMLTSGPLWGRKAWGVWWQWDTRLTTSFLLFMMMVAYLLARHYGGPAGRKLAAALALFAAISVPVVYKSVDMARTIHPQTTVVTTLDPRHADRVLELGAAHDAGLGAAVRAAAAAGAGACPARGAAARRRRCRGGANDESDTSRAVRCRVAGAGPGPGAGATVREGRRPTARGDPGDPVRGGGLRHHLDRDPVLRVRRRPRSGARRRRDRRARSGKWIARTPGRSHVRAGDRAAVLVALHLHPHRLPDRHRHRLHRRDRRRRATRSRSSRRRRPNARRARRNAPHVRQRRKATSNPRAGAILPRCPTSSSPTRRSS